MQDFVSLENFAEIELCAGERHVRSGAGERSVQTDQEDHNCANYGAHRNTPGVKWRQIQGLFVPMSITQDFTVPDQDFAAVKKLT
jgi:hypothetical protein